MDNEWLVLCFLDEFKDRDDMIVIKEELKNGDIKMMNIFTMNDFHISYIDSDRFCIEVMGSDCNQSLIIRDINNLNVLEYEEGIKIDMENIVIYLEKF